MAETNEVSEALREWTEIFMHRSMSGLVAFAKGHGLSMSQVGALFHLSHRGSCGVSDIGDSLGVTSAAASQMLDRLVQQSLIVRSEDPNDRRSKQIVLTERGRGFVRGLAEARQRWYLAIAEAMSRQEQSRVLTGLRILIEGANRIDPDVAPFELSSDGTAAANLRAGDTPRSTSADRAVTAEDSDRKA